VLDGAESVATPRSVWIAALVSSLLFLAIGAATGRTIGPSGDAVTVWATAQPHRTVLCVQDRDEPAFVVAAEPDDADQASVAAELISAERRLELGPVAAVVRDHANRGTLAVGPFEIPWMRNEYTGAWASWPSNLAWRIGGSPVAGWLVHFVLGALVVLAATLLAGRLAGWPAAVVCGLVLATDPLFHLYKRNLGGQEVMLQLLAVAVVSLVGAALLLGGRRRLVAAALLAGLALHTKLSFAALLASLLLVAPLLLPWRRLFGQDGRGRRAATAGLLVVALAVGSAPSWSFWIAKRQAGLELPAGTQESARGQFDLLLQRFVPSLSRATDVRRPIDGGDWERDPKKATGPLDLLFDPRRPWHGHFAARASHANRPDAEPGPAWRRTPLEEAGRFGVGLLVLLGALGAVLLVGGEIGRRRRGAALGLPAVGLGLVALAVALPTLLDVAAPDVHHLGLWVPLLAPGMGVAVAAAIGAAPPGRWRTVLLAVAGAALLVGCAGRLSSVVLVERDMDEQVGRLSDARQQQRLTEALEAAEAWAPAVVEYELMSQMEAWSAGRVRPWLYARSALGSSGPGCLRSADPRWLARIVQAHAGGHLVVAWGVTSRPNGVQPRTWLSPATVRAAGRAAGLEVRSLSELFDGRGRWYATLYAITE
jgi:hypothetical protein